MEKIVSKLRLKEERLFCKHLGVSQSVLPFKDTSLRNCASHYVNDQEFKEFALFKEVASSIQAIINRNHYDTILCPLGNSGQLDHYIVSKALIQISEQNRELRKKMLFYEDMPYSKSQNFEKIKNFAFSTIRSNDYFNVDITKQIIIKQQLIRLYHSQFGPGLDEKIIQYNRRISKKNHSENQTISFSERFWL